MSAFEWGEPIFSYTRAQAIADGVLVDLSPWAHEWMKVPIAITSGAWAEFIDWPEGHLPEYGQSEKARAQDVLMMLHREIVRNHKEKNPGDGRRVDFSVARVLSDGSSRIDSLYALCHPGDSGEAVVTIMLPGED